MRTGITRNEMTHILRNCLFCKWVFDEKERKKEEYRILDFEPENYFAILDREPKAAGHTLIISKKAYDDITDLKEGEETEFFDGVIKWSRKIEEKLNPTKVYVLSMCDHWDVEELPKGKLQLNICIFI